ncbi:hypothetical protein D1D85_23610, partial [Salmonella enterica]|nr:hypothetical protein [Salmonella enterica]
LLKVNKKHYKINHFIFNLNIKLKIPIYMFRHDKSGFVMNKFILRLLEYRLKQQEFRLKTFICRAVVIIVYVLTSKVLSYVQF